MSKLAVERSGWSGAGRWQTLPLLQWPRKEFLCPCLTANLKRS